MIISRGATSTITSFRIAKQRALKSVTTTTSWARLWAPHIASITWSARSALRFRYSLQLSMLRCLLESLWVRKATWPRNQSEQAKQGIVPSELAIKLHCTTWLALFSESFSRAACCLARHGRQRVLSKSKRYRHGCVPRGWRSAAWAEWNLLLQINQLF